MKLRRTTVGKRNQNRRQNLPISAKAYFYQYLKGLRYWTTVRFKSRRLQSNEYFEVNLLIVKNVSYVNLAYDCIRSFLAFHPNATFTIYVDLATSARMIERLKRRNILEVCTIIWINDTKKVWQEMKLDIILSQSGTKKLFMDADLRWYGPLPKINEVTFLVDEGPLMKSKIFKQVIESNESFNTEAHMLNVSFVALNGKVVSPEVQTKIKDTCENYDKIIRVAVGDAKEIELVGRLREQFAISIFTHEISSHYALLKKNDSRADKDALVSSCYFGSTGLNF